MSFREKSAWITLVTVVVCFGLYFGALAGGWIERFSMASFHYAIICIVALSVLQIVLHIVAAILNPKDARAPRDEREKMFESRSHALGYYLLVIWMLGILVAVHFPTVRKLDVVYLAMLGLVVTTAVVAIAQIIQFRRGA
jgi:hypothetical protein